MNTPHNFTTSDVQSGRIYADRSQLIDRPLPWQVRGLQQTASGYGAKLASRSMIRYNGRDRRIYVTQYGNAGSTWIQVRGQRIYVA